MECRTAQLEDRLKQMVDMKRLKKVEERDDRNTEMLAETDGSEVVASGGLVSNSEEECEIERMKPNVILYCVPEIQSDVAKDRKAGDMKCVRKVWALR